jgi:hypothetical protein
MKKLFFISALFISTFLFQKHADAQLLSLDAILNFPDTVVGDQTDTMAVVVSKSGGAIFTGDLTVFFHALNDSGPADTIAHFDLITISANTTADTIEVLYTFKESQLDAGDNIVVVWPASVSIPQEVNGDSLTFHVWLKNIGVEENKHRQSITLFPNPSSAKVRLFYSFPEKVEQVRVSDILGKEVLRFEEAVSGFSIEALDQGVYFVEVKDKDGGVVVKKFFRQ